MVLVSDKTNNVQVLDEEFTSTLRSGDLYLINGVTYILARVTDDRFALISLCNGNIYRSPEPGKDFAVPYGAKRIRAVTIRSER